MPNPHVSAEAEDSGRQFHLSRLFWASMVEDGDFADRAGFIHPTPHMDVVFGERDVAHLRARFETPQSVPLFAAMQYTKNPDIIASWAPLLMQGGDRGEPMAATRYEAEPMSTSGP